MSDQMMIPVSDSRGPTYDTPSDKPYDTSDSVSDKRLSARLDPAQNEALLTIMQGTGGDQSAAVRYALMLAADVCRTAWDLGYVNPRQLPVLNAYMVNLPGGRPAPVRLRRGTAGV